jgi:DNA-binding XRE family transcriptional regulator
MGVPWLHRTMPYPRAGNSLHVTYELLEGLDSLGSFVRERRRALGLSQAALERATGVDQTTISRLENGKLYHLRLSRLAAIFRVIHRLPPRRH